MFELSHLPSCWHALSDMLWRGQRQRKDFQQSLASRSTHCGGSSTCQWWDPTGALELMCDLHILSPWKICQHWTSVFKNSRMALHGITAYYWSFCGAVTVRKPSRFGNGALIHLTSTDASTWHAPWCIFSILWKQTRTCSCDATNTAHCILQRGTMTDVSSKSAEHIWTHLNTSEHIWTAGWTALT